MNIVSSTATIRQTSQAGKKEPTILKEGARVQLVNDSIPSASPYLTSGVCDINESGLNPDNYGQVCKRYDGVILRNSPSCFFVVTVITLRESYVTSGTLATDYTNSADFNP